MRQFILVIFAIVFIQPTFSQEKGIFDLPQNATVDTIDFDAFMLEKPFYDQRLEFIAIHQGGPFSSLPSYQLIIYNDGRVEYEGFDNVQRLGKLKGRLNSQVYNKVAVFIIENQFMNLPDYYTINSTDAGAFILSFKLNGVNKVIRSELTIAGPTKLWAVQSLMENLLHRIAWTE